MEIESLQQKKSMGENLLDVKFFILTKNFIKKKIFSKQANIKNYDWTLKMFQFLN